MAYRLHISNSTPVFTPFFTPVGPSHCHSSSENFAFAAVRLESLSYLLPNL